MLASILFTIFLKAQKMLTYHPPTIYKKMRDTGISEQSANRIISQYSLDYLNQKIDILEYLLSELPHSISNPAGYLFKSITEDYTPPSGYQTPEQRLTKRKLKAQNQAKQQEKQRRERISEIVFKLKKLMEQEELRCAAKLAHSMNGQIEASLRAFIEKNRQSNLRPCSNYDLRAASIQRKRGDFGAGTIFEILRVNFFKEAYPQIFSSITYHQIAKASGEFEGIPQAYLEEALTFISSH